MRTYTAHLKSGRQPVLVREGWSWGGFLLGPFWLFAQRAWLSGLIGIAVWVLAAAVLPPQLHGPAALGIALLTGLLGRDLVRWSLDRRGYVLAHVLAAADEDAATGRLLAARPDLAQRLLEHLS